jgi:hypothetical protein
MNCKQLFQNSGRLKNQFIKSLTIFFKNNLIYAEAAKVLWLLLLLLLKKHPHHHHQLKKKP